MRYHLTPVEWLSLRNIQITNVQDKVEKREPLYIVSRTVHYVNWCSNYGRQYGDTSKN